VQAAIAEFALAGRVTALAGRVTALAGLRDGLPLVHAEIPCAP
jgi:hypothetical protein